MHVVDTNILVYAANKDTPEHPKAYAFLDQCRRDPMPWYLTWGIIYEFCRVVTHPRVLPNPLSAATAWDFIRALLAAPSLDILVEGSRHAEIATQSLPELSSMSGNLFFDFHTAVLMREHGLRRIFTHDTDFHRFRFIEALDPLV